MDLLDSNNPGPSAPSRGNSSGPGAPGNREAGQKDLTAPVLILLYCILFAVLRLSVSSSMELDESEQFLNGSSLALGYAHQPPLYSWIVHIMSLLFGMNIRTLIITKYAILFSFYLVFYRIARSFWNGREALFITGSLLLFPTYTYEFNRDLSHSVLVTAMASITCALFVRLLERPRTVDYLLFGAAAGLGFLSKYNFAFFLSAVLLAAASLREGRRVLFDRKILLSLAVCLVVVLPHVLWLIQSDFLPFRHALSKAEVGTLPLSAARKVLPVILSSYSGIAIFLVVFTVFFGLRVSRRTEGSPSPLGFFRYLVVYGLTVPLLIIVVLQTGHFSERWLAPLLFAVPLTLFSGIDMEQNNTKVKGFGYLCIFVAVAVFVARSAIGFFPDAAGKVERIHTPFGDLALQLRKELEKRGVDDMRDLTVITGSRFLAANMMYRLPDAAMFLEDGSHEGATGAMRKKAGVILWDAGKEGENIPREFLREFPSALPFTILRAPYLRSEKFPPYALGVALVR